MLGRYIVCLAMIAGEKPLNTCNVLFLAASPFGTGQLALEEEVRLIEAKIRAAEYRDNLKLITKWAVRPDDLLQALNQHDARVMHFSGHGAPSEEILLLDEQRRAKPVSKAALVPQRGVNLSSVGESLYFARLAWLEAAVGGDERRAAFFLERLAGVGPVEWMGHGRVVVGDELADFRLQVVDRGKAGSAQRFAVQDAEEDLDLVEPRAVFRQEHEADTVGRVREEFAARVH